MAYILIKFDDLDEKCIGNFIRVFDFCKAKSIPVCFGIIGKSLEKQANDYVDSIRNMKNSYGEKLELWNHGYYHTKEEFSINTDEEQAESLFQTQRLMKEFFGETVTAFGSPYNNSAEATVRILSKSFPEINKFFSISDSDGSSKAKSFLIRCDCENIPGKVSVEYFRKEYERVKKYPYFIVQGHPGLWNDKDFEDFYNVIKILVDDGNEFVTATELSHKDISWIRDDKTKLLGDSLLRFASKHEKTFLFGASEVAREVYIFLAMLGINPAGFVVSNGFKTIDKLCDKNVFELSELKQKCVDCGLIPSILGKNLKRVFDKEAFDGIDVWEPEMGISYEEFIDYVRYVVSLKSWGLYE